MLKILVYIIIDFFCFVAKIKYLYKQKKEMSQKRHLFKKFLYLIVHYEQDEVPRKGISYREEFPND
jgi:hypothetical protein